MFKLDDLTRIVLPVVLAWFLCFSFRKPSSGWGHFLLFAPDSWCCTTQMPYVEIGWKESLHFICKLKFWNLGYARRCTAAWVRVQSQGSFVQGDLRAIHCSFLWPVLWRCRFLVSACVISKQPWSKVFQEAVWYWKEIIFWSIEMNLLEFCFHWHQRCLCQLLSIENVYRVAKYCQSASGNSTTNH